MRLIKLLAWILFFPLMLTHWGWKHGKKPAVVLGAMISALFILVGAFGSEQAYMEHESSPVARAEEVGADNAAEVLEPLGVDDDDQNVSQSWSDESVESREKPPRINEEQKRSIEYDAIGRSAAVSTESFEDIENDRRIEVDGGNLSGHRESKVVVDIGFGDREYWAFTNDYGQLVKVVADRIILQDEGNEAVLSSGRYYPDEAKVPGVESSLLDEGHVIADSLGGVANAYNITPQNSILNRHGYQAYMEDQIRKAGGCRDFVAIISYPDTETQIPSSYSFTYTLEGHVIHDEFENINPDEENKGLGQLDLGLAQTEAIVEASGPIADDSSAVQIIALDKKAEFVLIENVGSEDALLTGWKIVSERGEQSFEFPAYILAAGGQVMVGGYEARDQVDFVWEDGRGVWNNCRSDPAVLYDAIGMEAYRFDD